ncbi:MAG: dihydroorotate dehydrogenase-like protein [bacterium]|nr:dihydroorotate dehydrogenase-like protein [bacterium]
MDLSTTYLGLKLKHPLIAGANPIAATVDGIRSLEDGGASAVVLPSLFEEQLTHEALAIHYYTTIQADSYAEALSYFPQPSDFKVGPDEYLTLIQKAKTSVEIPIIASLNGFTDSGWIKIAKEMEKAGADAIELNVYYLATDPNIQGIDVEKHYLDISSSVKKSVKIPVAVKLSPFLSSPAAIAKTLSQNGIDGLVLFNRFYQPDFDLEKLEVIPNLHLSNSDELRLSLRWIAILFGKISADLSATGGCHTHLDAIKLLMAGADAIQMVSAILLHGVNHIQNTINQLSIWLGEHEYSSIKQLKGSMSHQNVADPSAFERANYMKVLQSFRVS